MSHEVKICPLMTMMSPVKPDKVALQVCIERDCAWWSKDEKSCTVVYIANALSAIDLSG